MLKQITAQGIHRVPVGGHLWRDFCKVRRMWQSMIRENSPADIIAISPRVEKKTGATLESPTLFLTEVMSKMGALAITYRNHQGKTKVMKSATIPLTDMQLPPEMDLHFTGHELVHAIQYRLRRLQPTSLFGLKGAALQAQDAYKALLDALAEPMMKSTEDLEFPPDLPGKQVAEKGKLFADKLLNEISGTIHSIAHNLSAKAVKYLKRNCLLEIQAHTLTKNAWMQEASHKISVLNDAFYIKFYRRVFAALRQEELQRNPLPQSTSAARFQVRSSSH